ncbi:cytochrome P450 [Hysterangium stoloniferum]|nr:cytochrome P450 [Hysterangium stoloniferum]
MLTTGNIIYDISLVISIGLCLVSYLVNRKNPVPTGLQLPPGPPGLPVIGNIGVMSKLYDRQAVDKWRQQYGDMMSVDLLGTRIIFVSSSAIAHQLFDKRSKIYSDRFPAMMINLMGWDFNIAFMRYGDWWRWHRKTLHQYVNANAVADYHAVQQNAARELVRSLYEDPDEFVDHCRHYAASIIMEVTYGLKLKPKNDPYVEIISIALVGVALFMNPGSCLVDLLPTSVKYLPGWFPGAGFKRMIQTYRKPTMEVADMPFKIVKEAMANGTAQPSIMESSLTKLQLSGNVTADQELVIKNVTGMAYAAGAGTSLSSLIYIILALALYPEMQLKARDEVDSVVGDRLPTMADRRDMPYLNAFCEETHRWRPTLPFSVAHTTARDDIYGDFYIPKGSVVIGDAWAMLHDPAVYKNPEAFDPERYLERNEPLPTAQWGFGRRICPGRYLASNTLFIAAAYIIKTFDITPAKDADGRDIPIPGTYAPGAVAVPDSFKCSIKPRSGAEKLILKN